MTLRTLPEAPTFDRPHNFHWDAPSDVLARWADRPQAAEADDPNTISIYDVIGEDFWTGGGFTAKRAAAALRSIGKHPVTVKINSPGGNMFEGIAIYNILREHPERVTIDVMGMAASAASVIAMAGDEIRMGLGTFVMIHNAWGLVIGNRHDMREAADLFEGFDGALVDIYEARTGRERAEVEKLMDAETFLSPSQAIEQGFADTVSDGLTAGDEAKSRIDPGLVARRRTEAALARAGISRNERSAMIADLVAHAAGRDAGRITAARDAGTEAALRRLLDTMQP